MDALVARARADFGRGDYRWVAEVMKHAVYADPEHAPARELAALAHEQMGFQAESATWRNAFLLAAREYREGPPPPAKGAAGNALLGALSNQLLFDVLAVRLNASRAGVQAFCMAWHFTDRQEHWLLELSNGALNNIQLAEPAQADVSLSTDRPTLEALLQQRLAPMQAVAEGRLRLAGNATLLVVFFGLLDRFTGNFPVVDAAPWPV